MKRPFIVIDRETNLPVPVATLEDAHGKFNPYDMRWRDRYLLRDPATGDEWAALKHHDKIAELKAQINDIIVSATIVDGQLDDLQELLHETD